MKTAKLLLLLSFVYFITINQSWATEIWPGEPWAESTNLTFLDNDFQANLSGAHWNENTQTLWVCTNGPGKFWALVENGLGSFEIDIQSGRRGEWNIPGDIEGITQVDLDEPSVYIIAENENIIRKYDVSVYDSAVLENSWNITAFVPAYNGSAGPEGIAFVPDEWLQLNGFVGSDGQPYTSQNGMGGLMFIAHQNGGAIYVFDLDPNSNQLDFVGQYRTLRNESSGLEFDRSSGKLYIWHNTGSNYIEITDTTSYVAANGFRYFSPVKEYFGPKGGNLEGIALSPASSDNRWYFATDDSNQNGAALMWFEDFNPEILGHDRYTTYQNKSITIEAPGLLHNDLGADTITLVQAPGHGRLTNLAVGDTFDGAFTYTPDTGFTGVDTFTYSADGIETAKVEIRVLPVQTITSSIAAATDDVEERNDGTIYTNSSDLELIQDAASQTIGLKFNAINIPAEATIVSATIQFATDETSSMATNLVIEGENSIQPAAFATTSRNVTNRQRTEAAINWAPAAWNVINEASLNQRTPDLTSIIEEIRQLPNWQSGNSLVFIISGAGKRVARAFEASPLLAPKLVIEYATDNDDPIVPVPRSLDIRIASGTHDVEENANGAVNNNSTDLELVTDTSVQTIGLRFGGITIPQGATITNASIQFAVDETSNALTELTIAAENAANAALFSNTAYNVSNRQLTAATIEWAPLAWNSIGEAGANQKTPDLTQIVQEIIDLPTWAAGNPLVFIIEGTGKRVAESYDGSPATAPLLHIEYLE